MLAFRLVMDKTTGATLAEPYCAECRSHPTLDYLPDTIYHVGDETRRAPIYRCPNCERWTLDPNA